MSCFLLPRHALPFPTWLSETTPSFLETRASFAYLFVYFKQTQSEEVTEQTILKHFLFLEFLAGLLIFGWQSQPESSSNPQDPLVIKLLKTTDSSAVSTCFKASFLVHISILVSLFLHKLVHNIEKDIITFKNPPPTAEATQHGVGSRSPW